MSVRKWVYEDELFPYYGLDDESHHPDDVAMNQELTDEQWAEYRRIMGEFDELQRYLKALHRRAWNEPAEDI